MNCPLCTSAATEKVFTAKGFPVRDCSRCAHRFAEISIGENYAEEIYDDSYFTGGGAGYSDYLAEGEMLRERGKDYAGILSKYGDAGRMLDVGAAAGFILQGFTDKNWRGCGIEPNEAMAKHARENFNLDISRGDLETFQTTEKFDLISMIQVAAHFHNPRRAFENAADLLKPNGLLLVETWNRKSLTARLLGKNWHEYSPPTVLQWFSPDGLSEFLRGYGFEKTAQGRPRKKISGAHAKSLLQYRLGEKPFFSALLKIIPDRMNFPYPAEDLFWAIYRKKI